MKLVSIIIPYFKKRKYFKKTLSSILSQKYKRYEILIVYDDPDQSELNFIFELIKKDRRIKIIKNKKNLGAGKSRNKAVKIAKGSFIAFLDADDIWHPNKLKVQILMMEKNNWKISHTSYQIINSNNKIIRTRFAKNLNYKMLLNSCDIGLSTVVLKKELLTSLKFAELQTKEDYVLWLKLAKKKHIFYGIDKNLTFWRKSENSLSSSVFRRLVDGYMVYRKFLKKSFLESSLRLIILSLNYLKK